MECRAARLVEMEGEEGEENLTDLLVEWREGMGGEGRVGYVHIWVGLGRVRLHRAGLVIVCGDFVEEVGRVCRGLL